MSVLESIGAAMPGVGYLVGGLIATGHDPRATFLVAGLGVFAIVAIATPLLGTNWPERKSTIDPDGLDAADDVVVELIPAGAALPRTKTEQQFPRQQPNWRS